VSIGPQLYQQQCEARGTLAVFTSERKRENWGRCLQYIKLDRRIVRRKSESETWKKWKRELEKKKETNKRSKRKQYSLKIVSQS